MDARDEILGKIKRTLEQRTFDKQNAPDMSESIYTPLQTSLDVKFKEEVNALQSDVYFCEDHSGFNQKLKEVIDLYGLTNLYCFEPELNSIMDFPAKKDQVSTSDMEACLTSCELLIARTGSVLVSANQLNGRQAYFFPPVHMVYASYDQLVFDLEDAWQVLGNKYDNDLPSLTTLITGQSRTADIEKTLILGAHGPKKIVVFLIKEPNKK